MFPNYRYLILFKDKSGIINKNFEDLFYPYVEMGIVGKQKVNFGGKTNAICFLHY